MFKDRGSSSLSISNFDNQNEELCYHSGPVLNTNPHSSEYKMSSSHLHLDII